jgi:serine/threonine protein kinase
MKRLVLGEGAYGCVHKPSLQCINPPKPNFDYKDYVSKIMKTKNAITELNEFVVIQKLDPNDEYHLGKPEICKPILNENVKKDIEKCKNVEVKDINANPDNYSLLILQFGGPDLKALCSNFLDNYLVTNKKNKVDLFWLEVHHLLKGLKFFKENGIVHNDIKPQNILFNQKTGKMKYIDFGLMRKKTDIINASIQSVNSLGVYHWSYPFDCGTMNKTMYNKYDDLDREEKYIWKRELSELIITKSKLNTFNLPINKPESFQILFTYLNPRNTVPSASTQYSYIDSFFDGFNDLIESKSYEDVLDIVTDSIDIFGLGFSMQFMANCFKRIGALNVEFFTRLSGFFHKMYDFNPKTRVIDITLLLEEYENILLELGVLTRLKKSFVNHSLVDVVPASHAIVKKARIDESLKPMPLSNDLEKYANKDVLDLDIDVIVKIKKTKKSKSKCLESEGNEINPFTKRCIKKCKEGYYRDEKFKCKKVNEIKASKKTRTKDAKEAKERKCLESEGKELNPFTRRCVKKCKEGYYRDENFKCKKTRKNRR